MAEHLRVLGGNARQGGELRRGIVLAVVERREDAGELSDPVPAEREQRAALRRTRLDHLRADELLERFDERAGRLMDGLAERLTSHRADRQLPDQPKPTRVDERAQRGERRRIQLPLLATIHGARV